MSIIIILLYFSQDLFVFEITSVKELALGANTDMPVNRIKWTTDGKTRKKL